VSNSQSAVFRKDQTATLVARLRHNVIKVALRQINLAYSRIPLSVIAQQLGLDSEVCASYRQI
jgi:26S proteasome regulatory subunit N3